VVSQPPQAFIVTVLDRNIVTIQKVGAHAFRDNLTNKKEQLS